MSNAKWLNFFLVAGVLIVICFAVAIGGCIKQDVPSVNRVTEQTQNVTLKKLLDTRDIPVGVSLVHFKKENLTCLIHEASGGAGNIICDWTTYRNEGLNEAF